MEQTTSEGQAERMHVLGHSWPHSEWPREALQASPEGLELDGQLDALQAEIDSLDKLYQQPMQNEQNELLYG